MSENKHTLDQSKILTAEQEAELVKPIDEHVGEIQKQIDALRAEGEEKIVTLKNQIQLSKENKALNKEERANLIAAAEAEIVKAKEVEATNKKEVDRLINEVEAYLKDHYEADYESKVDDSCEARKALANVRYSEKCAAIEQEHKDNLAKLNSSDPNYKQEVKDENYVFKNKKFDAKMRYDKELQEVKDAKHEYLREYILDHVSQEHT